MDLIVLKGKYLPKMTLLCPLEICAHRGYTTLALCLGAQKHSIIFYFIFSFFKLVFSTPLISFEEGFIVRGKPVSYHRSSFPPEPLMGHMNQNHSETALDP